MTDAINTFSTKTAMIVAGGTGGHIFPGLAVANELRNRGWNIVWLGTRKGMESQIAPQNNFKFEGIEFSGLRGKKLLTWLMLPIYLIKACVQAARAIKKNKPSIVLGFGGYVTFPAGLVCRLLAIPLFLHEQNSVAGLSNLALSKFATRIFTAFPKVIDHAHWIGNPLRFEFSRQSEPGVRFGNRQGPLKILVLGGSLGAHFLNQIVPQAIHLIPDGCRPEITHQSGKGQLDALCLSYKRLNINAEVVAFIENTAEAFAAADLVICRAGASTVTELAAVGAAAMFVPFPSAVDDHQTKNARYLVESKGAWLQPQEQLTPKKLADFILGLDRGILLTTAIEAKKMHKQGALNALVDACEDTIK